MAAHLFILAHLARGLYAELDALVQFLVGGKFLPGEDDHCNVLPIRFKARKKKPAMAIKGA